MTDDVSTEFEVLPPPLRGAAHRMLDNLSKTYDLGSLTPRDIATVIAAPSFRAVLEHEAQLDGLTLAAADDNKGDL